MAKEGSKKLSQREMQEILIQNFVGLQKAMTNLSIRFESLSDQMKRLLEVFELSAKNFASSAPDSKDKEDFLDKINSLLDQNKTIARGLVLLEEKLKGPQSSQPSQYQPPQQRSMAEEGYQESKMTDFPKPKPLPRI